MLQLLSVDSIPFLMVLWYIPWVCYLDIKYRKVNPFFFVPMIIICLPILFNYLAGSPARNYLLMEITLVLCLVWFVLAVFGAIGGGDFLFASLIMIFVQDYPMVVPRVWFPLDFFIVTWLCACTLPIIAYVHNLRNYNEMPLWRDTKWIFVDMRMPAKTIQERYNCGEERWVKIEDGYSLKKMLTDYPGRFPYMVVISIAFLITMTVGILT